MKTRAVVLLMVILAGCVSQPIAPTRSTIAARVKPGDAVELVTADGSKGQYRVVAVGSDALRVQPQAHGASAPEKSIPYGEISEFNVTRLNTEAIGAGLTAASVVVGLSLIWALPNLGAMGCC